MIDSEVAYIDFFVFIDVEVKHTHNKHTHTKPPPTHTQITFINKYTQKYQHKEEILLNTVNILLIVPLGRVHITNTSLLLSVFQHPF